MADALSADVAEHPSASYPIMTTVQLDPDSAWFAGHFPGDPVLPGIAQLGMVQDVIRQSSGEDLSTANLSRVKFKRLVRPGDILSIQVVPDSVAADTYSFTITVKGKEVCNGIMKVKRIKG